MVRFGPSVRTVGSDQNRGKKIEIGIENSVFELKSDFESVKIRFRFGLGSQNHESNQRFTILTVLGGSVRFDQKKFQFF